MKVLVTGAAGFIGSNVCEYFLNKGHTVVGVDNFNDYYPKKIKEFNLSSIGSNSKFLFLEGDIYDRSFVENLYKGKNIEAVIHMAAWAGVTSSVTDPDIYIKVNVDGTNNLVEYGVKYGLRHFVLASTSSVYGNTDKTPFSEVMSTRCTLSCNKESL